MHAAETDLIFHMYDWINICLSVEQIKFQDWVSLANCIWTDYEKRAQYASTYPLYM